MRDDKLSRRRVLRVLGAVPMLGVAAGATGLVAACGKKSEPDSCNDVSALGDAEKAARSALQYADTSPQPGKRCELCTLFQASTDPAVCAGCQVVKGPIHPKGYCTAFAAKPT